MRRQFEHQSGRCCWCLKQMDMSRENRGTNPLAATWEHIIPQVNGGTHDLSNLVLAHAICNHRRGSKILKIPHYRSYTLAADEVSDG